MIKKVVKITGKNYTQEWPVEDWDNIIQRVDIDVQLHNRDNPEDPWEFSVMEVEK